MELQGRRILVIGGAGFIGSHLVEELLREPVAEVLIYDNFTRGEKRWLTNALRDPRCRVFPLGGDILHRDLLAEALRGIDGVFHLAALWLLHCQEFPRAAFEVNVGGMFNVLEAVAAAGVKRFVYSSSASVYGDAVTDPMTEEHPFMNRTFYGATKISGEEMLKAMALRSGYEWVGLRYMNVYGPRQDYRGAYVAVIHKILDALEAGRPVSLHGDGRQTYDFVDVRDVARANVLAMKATSSGQFYNIGTGRGTDLNTLAREAMVATGISAEIVYEAQKSSFVTRRIGSTEKAERELAFVAQRGLAEGLKDLVAWRRHDAEAATGDKDRR